MRLRWRWDQGRTEYFSVHALAQAARVLVRHEGQSLDDVKASLREQMVKATGLPFLPDAEEYLSIWRNYARIFQAAQLAARVNGRLVVTDIGRKLSVPGLDPISWTPDAP